MRTWTRTAARCTARGKKRPTRGRSCSVPWHSSVRAPPPTRPSLSPVLCKPNLPASVLVPQRVTPHTGLMAIETAASGTCCSTADKEPAKSHVPHHHSLGGLETTGKGGKSGAVAAIAAFTAFIIHCVLEGLALGVVGDDIMVMFVAVGAHKGFAAFALGAAVFRAFDNCKATHTAHRYRHRSPISPVPARRACHGQLPGSEKRGGLPTSLAPHSCAEACTGRIRLRRRCACLASPSPRRSACSSDTPRPPPRGQRARCRSPSTRWRRAPILQMGAVEVLGSEMMEGHGKCPGIVKYLFAMMGFAVMAVLALYC